MQQEALDVLTTWGFTLKSELVWVKTVASSGNVATGMGHYVRGAHEVCLIGTMGRVRPNTRSQRSVFTAPRDIHSRKPSEFYEIVRAMTDTPRVELFARQQRDGFETFGDEL